MNQVSDRDSRLSVSRDIFLSELRKMPSRPASRNRPLKDLVSRFRRDLGDCTDEIPLNLSRFGMAERMSFSNFLYLVTWS